MEKIIKKYIVVFCPSLEQEFRFLVPASMNVAQGIELMIEAIQMEYLISTDINQLILLNESSGEILNPIAKFKNMNILDGDRFILI